MADNYLERREEELRSARSISVRKASPSLEELLAKCAEESAFDPSYQVHPRQVEAIIAVIGKYLQPLPFTIETASAIEAASATETANAIEAASAPKAESGTIIITPDALDRDAIICLGKVLMAIELKAAEMGLAARCEGINDNKVQIKIGKPAKQ